MTRTIHGASGFFWLRYAADLKLNLVGVLLTVILLQTFSLGGECSSLPACLRPTGADTRW